MRIPGLNHYTLTAACIATASRLVGASFRVGDAYNQQLRSHGMSIDPKIVVKREGVSLGLSWCASLVAAMGANSLLKRHKVGRTMSRLMIAVLGTGIAELTGRLVAYRHLGGTSQVDNKPSTAPNQTPLPPPASVRTSSSPMPANHTIAPASAAPFGPMTRPPAHPTAQQPAGTRPNPNAPIPSAAPVSAPALAPGQQTC